MHQITRGSKNHFFALLFFQAYTLHVKSYIIYPRVLVWVYKQREDTYAHTISFLYQKVIQQTKTNHHCTKKKKNQETRFNRRSSTTTLKLFRKLFTVIFLIRIIGVALTTTAHQSSLPPHPHSFHVQQTQSTNLLFLSDYRNLLR